MEPESDPLPVLTGISNPREDNKSELNVVAKLNNVGGINVSPLVSTESLYNASTMMEVTEFRDNFSVLLDFANGTVGIPSNLASINSISPRRRIS